ncbi:MAG TPA: hypothetical protein DDW51_05540 [Cyanobacteria bacterium UBA11367]|nr:hypothetical protein [Cyanobacteria bacterium UBA11367]HBE56795.1 hypothetical protein [Cyanobacteria bacterium UBA11366]HCA94644.1 hypothetical protein [Cyanobacteria bacterium UBA9226]
MEANQRIEYIVAIFTYSIGSLTEYFSTQFFNADGDIYSDLDEVTNFFKSYEQAHEFTAHLIEVGHKQPVVIPITIFEE